MCSVNLNVGAITGTTLIKTLFSFSPSIDKHLIGKTLCSSDDSVTQLIHIFFLLFHDK